MADYWHGYLAIEDLSLTTDQRQAILAAFRALGPTRAESDWPPFLNQVRVSLDGSKAIYEARFRLVNLTVDNVVSFLADAAGVDPSLITPDTTPTARGPLLVLYAGGTPRMQMLLFGELTADWETSRQQTLIYLSNNRIEWEDSNA